VSEFAKVGETWLLNWCRSSRLEKGVDDILLERG
jgi:hypothetical protein